MCSGPEQSSKMTSTPSPSTVDTASNNPKDMGLTVETEDLFSSLLEFAANDDIEGFKRSVEHDASLIDEVGLWYCRQRGSNRVVLDHRTPLMVAATYGSLNVLKFIISHAEVNVNFTCGVGKTTALHCAASGGSVNAVDAVRLLLSVGANPDCVDANDHRPVDVIVVPPKHDIMKINLEDFLLNNVSKNLVGEDNSIAPVHDSQISMATSDSSSPTLSSSPEIESPHSPSQLLSSPVASKFSSTSEKKEYPVDPSIPDIKSSMYATDEFRMFSFKVLPCSRAYSHDWTECPFAHPGENARRRDPRKFNYSCVPCPDFRKGACARGEMCEYAHGIFESWLHPAQYRTRPCNDGVSCNRRVCFFAHTPEELRPLYTASGSAVLSPQSSASAANIMDMAAALNLLPGSPSSVSAMSPTPFNQPMSPSNNGNLRSSIPWPQPNVPHLHLPESNFQSSRLRTSLSARDIPPEDLNFSPDFDGQQQILNDITCISQQHNVSTYLSRSALSKSLTPSNLEDLFCAELSSPRYADQAPAVFSPKQRSAVLNQFQQQQNLLSPIRTNTCSPKNVEHPLLQASFGVGSPGRMSPRSMGSISPVSARGSAFTQREKQQQLQLYTLGARDLGLKKSAVSKVGSPLSFCRKWGSPTAKADWSVDGAELNSVRESSSFELGNTGEEPDLSWVHSLVREAPPPPNLKDKHCAPLSSVAPPNQNSDVGSVIESWLEQMQIDQQQH